jgi:Tol biopolymer transport system component
MTNSRCSTTRHNSRRLISLLAGALAGLFLVQTAVAAASNGAPMPAAGDLCVARVMRLTHDNQYYMRPMWSPDGSLIAFTRGKSTGIEVMKADGSGRRVLTDEAAAGYKFAWSPDNTEIAFRTINYSNGLATIKVASVASGKVETLSGPAPDVHPPQWAHAEKGKRVSFVADGKIVHTAWRPMAGSQRASPAGGKPAPALFFDRQNIWVLDESGEEPRPLTEGVGFDPVRSPDGARIVYSQMDTLVFMNADGTGKQSLGVGNRPAWSPDSRKLVFQITRDHTHAPDDPRAHGPDTAQHRHHDKTNHQIEESDLFVMNADGTARTQLTHTQDELEADPHWSSDGRRIVYRTENAGQIYVIELDW